LTTIADVFIETVAPDGSESHLSKFHKRYGDHLHSLAWYVDGLADLWERLDSHGYKLFGVDGSRVEEPPSFMDNQMGELYTHPRETPGMHQFAEMGPEFAAKFASEADFRLRPDWKLEDPSADDPLGVEVGSHHTVVVQHLGDSVKFFVDALDGDLFHEAENRSLGSRSAYVWVGEGTVIEVAQPISPGPAMDDLTRCGNMPHAITFKVQDLDKAVSHLTKQGVRLEHRSESMAVSDPTDSLGTRFGFTAALTPNDPRRTGNFTS
jgi:hypothetical protein